jgi:hypothetical protein
MSDRKCDEPLVTKRGIGHSFAMKFFDTMICLKRWHQASPARGCNGVEPPV